MAVDNIPSARSGQPWFIRMAKAEKAKKAFRVEKDPLGEKNVSAKALYGVQTARALENIRISGLRIHPQFYRAYAEIKRAAADANMEMGKLPPKKGKAIVKAANELIAGQWADQFDLDVFQAGAGTSYNMNFNEVIANRALEVMGLERGRHDEINPNDDVNKSQFCMSIYTHQSASSSDSCLCPKRQLGRISCTMDE